MAEITATVFVNDWKYQTDEPNPSWGMKVSESHSKKEGTEYVKTGSTSWTVKNGWDAAAGGPAKFDFTEYRSGDRLKISGVQVTETSESNGKTYKNLILKATSIEVVSADRAAPISNAWVEVEEPF